MGHDPDSPRLSRRAFLSTSAVGALGLLAARCGDDRQGPPTDVDDATPNADAAPVDTDATSADAPPEAADDAAPDVPDAPDDAAPDVPEPPPRFDPETYLDASDSLFPVGVTATDPVPGGVLVATRYVGTDPLELIVWRLDGAGADGVLAVRRPVTLAAGGFALEDVRGLVAQAEHRFTFVAAARKSAVGRFRTPPPDGATPVVVLGATSCAKWDFRPFDVLTRAAEADLDLFLLLGDTTYADDSTTLDEYRANWARNLGSAEYRALRASTTCVATWDDHEVANNWDPEETDPALIATARQAFVEHLAPRLDPAFPERLWRSIRWGRTVEVFVLDCRGERRPSTRDTAEAQYVSEAQLAWLGASLAASTAVFKLVLSSVPMTDMPVLFLGAAERWEGYAAQRARALALTAGVPGLLWLAGDFHFGAVTTVDPPGGAHADQREVLVGPVAHLNPGIAIVQATGSPEQFPFLTGDRNYGRFTLDPTTTPPRITVEHIGTDGAVLGSRVMEV